MIDIPMIQRLLLPLSLDGVIVLAYLNICLDAECIKSFVAGLQVKRSYVALPVQRDRLGGTVSPSE